MEHTGIKQFFGEYRETLNLNVHGGSNSTNEEFMYYWANILEDAGEIDGFEYCYCKKPKGAQVNGYYYSEDDILYLFVADFDDLDVLKLVDVHEAGEILKRPVRFFKQCLKKDYYKGFAVGSPEYSLGEIIYKKQKSITKLSLYLISERNLEIKRKRALSVSQVQGIPVSVHVWDISRFYKMGDGMEPVEIKFSESIPCLQVMDNSDGNRYYMVAFPGKVLAACYDRYGSRFLESNVRCFLQARGKVNQGIIETVKNTPKMFFAYNNGLSATATEIQIENGAGGPGIKMIKELQIVNGGQTTASLSYAKRKFNADLSMVSVQMKLSVIPKEKYNEIVPNISRYANTQNRIVDADFASNHPFQIKMEQMSRKIEAPVAGSSLQGTYWFYERAKGQYSDAQSHLTTASRKAFQAKYPRAQVITKTNLGKYENVWFEHPKLVNLGAQKNFAAFAERINSEWKTNPEKFDDNFYRQCIARAILFKKTESLVSRQSWYGGYRANIVAYTLAVMAEKYKKAGTQDELFSYVWKNQKVSENDETILVKIAEIVNRSIMSSAGVTNISEWCKKEECWNKIKRDLNI